VKGEVPKWEDELWYFLSRIDGVHCPYRGRCQVRKSGKWCPDENKERLEKLADSKQFSLKDYDFIECGSCSRLTRTLERLTQKWLKKGRVHSPPVPTEFIEVIAAEYPLEVRFVPLRVYHGATWHLKEEAVIQINRNDPPATQRFTLFHEVFHVLCRYEGAYVFSGEGIREAPFKDLLAHYFAGSLLMPIEWVEEKWAEVKDLDRMAEIFGVPKSAMCVRLKRLGLV